tara:strand:- start:85 stop:810 length:726 start_codon:yes stop_codon:yes gene_type:complete
MNQNEIDEKRELVATDDIKPILQVLREEDQVAMVAMKEDLADAWHKRQLYRTETEMRLVVLNDGKHPTTAAKYWQAVREQTVMFDNVMNKSFELRKNKISRLKLERKLERLLSSDKQNADLKAMEAQVDLDHNLFERAHIEADVHDRVRELKLWEQMKKELDDGTFNNQDPNSHQSLSLPKKFQHQLNSLNDSSAQAEVINSTGVSATTQRLVDGSGNMKTFDGKTIVPSIEGPSTLKIEK